MQSESSAQQTGLLAGARSSQSLDSGLILVGLVLLIIERGPPGI